MRQTWMSPARSHDLESGIERSIRCAILNSSTQSSDSVLAPARRSCARSHHVSHSVICATQGLWERFNGGFLSDYWTRGPSALAPLSGLRPARPTARPQRVWDARAPARRLLHGSTFQCIAHLLSAHAHACWRQAGSAPRTSVFVSLILTTLSTSFGFSIVATSCLIVFGHSDIAFAAGIYLILWLSQDALRRALLAQFSHQSSRDRRQHHLYRRGRRHRHPRRFSQPQFVKRALCDGRDMRQVAIALQIYQRPPTFPPHQQCAQLTARLLDAWQMGLSANGS